MKLDVPWFNVQEKERPYRVAAGAAALAGVSVWAKWLGG